MAFGMLVRRLAHVILASILITAVTPCVAQEVWFAPHEPRAPHTHLLGVTDWAALFEPDAPWKVAAAGTHVFHITPGYVIDAPDADLLRLKADTARRGMVIAIGIQSIAVTDADGCGRTEGYVYLRSVDAVLAKLKRLGVTPAYVSLDEPVWFGHYATGAQDCKFSIEEVARRSAETVQQYISAFPDAVIGDIDNVPVLTIQPDWQQSYLRFKSDFEHRVGRKFQYMQLDVDWRNPSLSEHMVLIAKFARSQGMKLGIIYNGDGNDTDNASWIAHAERNFEIVESQYGILPDQAIFVSWNKFPTEALPETSPAAHTWLIRRYLLPRSRFVIDASTATLKGRLVDRDGHAIAGAAVQVDVMGADQDRYPATHDVTGTVPDTATSAIMAIRINQECLCAGDNDALIGDLSYAEQRPGAVSTIYSATSELARNQSRAPDAGLAHMERIGGKAVAQVTVPSHRTLGLNSPKFTVTPGATFTFKVPMASLTDKGVFGTAAIIWLDSQGHGLRRTNVVIAPELRPYQSLKTDAAGGFEVKLPEKKGGGRRSLQLHYAGTNDRRGAYAEVR